MTEPAARCVYSCRFAAFCDESKVGTREDDYQSFFNYRDATQTYVTGRAAYAVSPDVALFVQARTNDISYDLTGSNRDSTQTSLEVGEPRAWLLLREILTSVRRTFHFPAVYGLLLRSGSFPLAPLHPPDLVIPA